MTPIDHMDAARYIQVYNVDDKYTIPALGPLRLDYDTADRQGQGGTLGGAFSEDTGAVDALAVRPITSSNWFAANPGGFARQGNLALVGVCGPAPIPPRSWGQATFDYPALARVSGAKVGRRLSTMGAFPLFPIIEEEGVPSQAFGPGSGFLRRWSSTLSEDFAGSFNAGQSGQLEPLYVVKPLAFGDELEGDAWVVKAPVTETRDTAYFRAGVTTASDTATIAVQIFEVLNVQIGDSPFASIASGGSGINLSLPGTYEFWMQVFVSEVDGEVESPFPTSRFNMLVGKEDVSELVDASSVGPTILLDFTYQPWPLGIREGYPGVRMYGRYPFMTMYTRAEALIAAPFVSVDAEQSRQPLAKLILNMIQTGEALADFRIRGYITYRGDTVPMVGDGDLTDSIHGAF